MKLLEIKFVKKPSYYGFCLHLQRNVEEESDGTRVYAGYNHKGRSSKDKQVAELKD